MVNVELLFEWAPGKLIVKDDTSGVTNTVFNTPPEHGNMGHEKVIFYDTDPEGEYKNHE